MSLDINRTEDPIEKLVEGLRLTRIVSQEKRYKGRPTPDLPSRDAVIGLGEKVVAVLYPRHFGPPGLVPAETDAFVRAELRAVQTVLAQQAALELRLLGGDASAAPDLARAFIARLLRLRAVHDTDIAAAFAGDPSAKSLDEVVFCFPGVAAVLRHRIAHELFHLGVPMLARILAERAHATSGIDIHPGARIGPAFFIDHGTGVVIGETAEIGRNVRLYQHVTLGAKRFEDDGAGGLVKGLPRHPIVEDDVVIYAGATVLGRITLGKGSTIGGGVWLTRSTPPGSVVTQALPDLATQGR
jgi:serine O-acetyltransferase